MIEPWEGVEVKMRCSRCHRTLDVLCVSRHEVAAVIGTTGHHRTGRGGPSTIPHVKTGRLTQVRPHVRREMRGGDPPTGMTWFCPCGAQHARNFAALVEPFVRAAEAGEDLEV